MKNPCFLGFRHKVFYKFTTPIKYFDIFIGLCELVLFPLFFNCFSSILAFSKKHTLVRERWGIETLFGILKTRGFCLESTHFTDVKQLSKLVCLLSLALCWAIKTGEWLAELHPIPIKKHGRLAKSIFRYGLDFLCSIFLDLDMKSHDFFLP